MSSRDRRRRRPVPEEGRAVGFDELLDELPQALVGPMAGEMRERSRRRASHLFDIVTLFPPLWMALAQLRDALGWASRLPGLDPNVASLLEQSRDRILLGVEALLSEQGPRDLDQSRFLMEVEYLLKDFTADPAALTRWASLPQHHRNREFGFGSVRRREEHRLNAPTDHVLRSRDEYRAHSASVHPRPAAEITVDPVEPDSRRPSLFMDLGDLVQHSQRVWAAALDYLTQPGAFGNKPDEPDEPDEPMPDLSSLKAAADMINRFNTDAGVPSKDSDFSHMHDDIVSATAERLRNQPD